MKKKRSSFIIFLFCILLSCGTLISIKADAKEKILWDKSSKQKIIDGNYRYFVYFSSDKKYSWVYKVKQVKKREMEELALPETINGAVLKKIGYENKKNVDDVKNLMGAIAEPYHNLDGYDRTPKGIKSVLIPSTVTEICKAAFCGFRDLKSIQIPDGVKTLNYALCYQCSSLERVVLPKKLEKMGNDVFKRCKRLKKFSISKHSKKYCCVDNMLLSKDKKRFIVVPTGMKNVTIPETVIELAAGAFLNTNVKKIFIPASVRSIQKGGLQGKKIRTIEISPENKVYAMAKNFIYKKKNGELTAIINNGKNVTLPKQIKILSNNVSTIGKGIKNLIIPKTVKKLKKNCFYYGINMASTATVYFEAKTPPSMAKGSFYSFASYFVPEKSLEQYKECYYKAENLEEGEKEYTMFVGYKEKYIKGETVYEAVNDPATGLKSFVSAYIPELEVTGSGKNQVLEITGNDSISFRTMLYYSTKKDGTYKLILGSYLGKTKISKIKELKKGKTWYIKARFCDVDDFNNVVTYGDFSKPKEIKVK